MKNLIKYETDYTKASNAYLMSLFVFFFGLPIPIVNLVVVIVYYFIHRSESYLVRWHATQVMLSQIPLFVLNSMLFWWSINLLLAGNFYNLHYFVFLFGVILINIIELIATIYAAQAIRNGGKTRWFLVCNITDLLMQHKNDETKCFVS